MVTFSPPVASWSFPNPDHTLDELWYQLLSGCSALAMEHVNDELEDTRKKLKVRIMSILIYWKAQGWVSFEPKKAEVPEAPHQT